MKNYTLGLQMFSSVLMFSAVAFYALGSKGLCATCMIMAVFFWTAIYSESIKK